MSVERAAVLNADRHDLAIKPSAYSKISTLFIDFSAFLAVTRVKISRESGVWLLLQKTVNAIHDYTCCHTLFISWLQFDFAALSLIHDSLSYLHQLPPSLWKSMLPLGDIVHRLHRALSFSTAPLRAGCKVLCLRSSLKLSLTADDESSQQMCSGSFFHNQWYWHLHNENGHW